jgi:hypothetical protein
VTISASSAALTLAVVSFSKGLGGLALGDPRVEAAVLSVGSSSTSNA